MAQKCCGSHSLVLRLILITTNERVSGWVGRGRRKTGPQDDVTCRGSLHALACIHRQPCTPISSKKYMGGSDNGAGQWPFDTEYDKLGSSLKRVDIGKGIDQAWH
jgi:hypothetical protein